MIKNKRKNSVLLVIALLLAITVGYAAIATTLKINGSGDIKKATWNVHWQNPQVNDESVTQTKPTLSEGNTVATFNVTLTEPGDFYEFTIDAKNDGTLDAMIETIESKINNEALTSENLPDYLEYTVKYDNGSDINVNDELLSGGTQKYRVKLKYRQDIDPSVLEDIDHTFNFEFSIKYVQKPKTNNNGGNSTTNNSGLIITNPTNGTTDGTKQYFASTWINDNAVYYDPTVPAACTREQYEANTQLSQNIGCMRWYAYSTENGKVNLLLDHNISSTDIEWANTTDYYNPTTQGITFTYNYTEGTTGEAYNLKGPQTAYKQLQTLTSNWNTSGVGTYTSRIKAEYYDGSSYHSLDEPVTYTIDHSSYKARFIQAEEIARLIGDNSWDSLEGNYFSEIPMYLGNGLSDSGYWTETAVGNSYMYMAWTVYKDSGNEKPGMNDDYASNNAGIRPVITVPVTIVTE